MRVLGKGSFGTVYEGMTSEGKLVAVKVMDIPVSNDESAEEAKEWISIQDEINLLRSLEHPSIVTYYGCQTKKDEGTGALVMEIFLELCHGGSLAALRRRFAKAKEPFSMRLVRTYTRQILRGLEYLHGKKVMHRDLKAENVLIAASGEAKLSDFGCSKRMGGTTGGGGGGIAGGQGEATTPSGTTRNAHLYHTVVGSPLFMAPEVLNASESGSGYTESADIWSLGCVVLELLGREPWVTGAEGEMNLFKLLFLISNSSGMPTGVPKKCPDMLQDFFTKVFERNPEKRWAASKLLAHKWIICPDAELEDLPPQD